MTGKITQVSGSVADVTFAGGRLPKIREALRVTGDDGKVRIMEVASHISPTVARCIMLAESEGLYAGMEVEATGEGITVPVGRLCWGACSTCLASLSTAAKRCPMILRARPYTAIPRGFPSRTPGRKFSKLVLKLSIFYVLMLKVVKSVYSVAQVLVKLF